MVATGPVILIILVGNIGIIVDSTMQPPIELISDAESDLEDWQALLDGFTEPRSKAAALPPPRSGQLSPRVPALQQVSSIGILPHPQPSDLVVHAGIPRVGSWSSSLTPPIAPGPHPRFERSLKPLCQNHALKFTRVRVFAGVTIFWTVCVLPKLCPILDRFWNRTLRQSWTRACAFLPNDRQRLQLGRYFEPGTPALVHCC